MFVVIPVIQTVMHRVSTRKLNQEINMHHFYRFSRQPIEIEMDEIFVITFLLLRLGEIFSHVCKW